MQFVTDIDGRIKTLIMDGTPDPDNMPVMLSPSNFNNYKYINGNFLYDPLPDEAVIVEDDTKARLDDIEMALFELASIIGGGSVG